MAQNNSVVITLSARDEASRVIDRLKGSLTAASAAGNILANIITNTVSKAFEGLTSSIKKTADAELSTLSAASAYSRLTGLSFKEAKGEVELMTDALAEQAAVLPGVTSEYVAIGKGIYDDLIPAFKQLNGNFDKEAFRDYATDIVTQLGIIKSATGEETVNISKAISKLLSGDSTLAEVGKHVWFRESKLFNLIENKLAELGKTGKDLKGMAQSEILKMLDLSLDELVTPEYIAAASESFSGIWEGFMSLLFDENIGWLLGWGRDLDKDLKGKQTAFNSLKQVLKSLVGSDGLFNQLGRVMNELGLGGDPMKGMAVGLNKLNDFIVRFTTFLTSFNGSDLTSFQIGKWSADLFNKLVNNITETLNNPELPKLFWEAIKQLTVGLGSFILNLDYGGIKDMFWGVLTFMPKLLFEGLKTLGGSVLELIGMALSGIWDSITNTSKKVLNSVTNFSKKLLSSIGDLSDKFKEIFQGAASTVIRIKDRIVNFFMDPALAALNSIKKLFDNIKSKFQGAIDFFNGIEFPWSKDKDEPQDIPPVDNPPVQNAASGMNYSNLLSAARREANNAPSGSSLVMANSSEAILNKAQQAQLISSMGNKGGITIGNITINTQATDAKGIAKDIMAQINYEFNKYSQGYIAAPVS